MAQLATNMSANKKRVYAGNGHLYSGLSMAVYSER